MQYVFVLGVLALMALSLLVAPDRSVRLAQELIEDGRLYALSDEEHANLRAFLNALAGVTRVTKSFAINAPYDAGRINLYIVDVESGPNSVFPHGNAAYASRSDIIFIDAAYFRHGSEKRVFADADDTLSASVLTPLRIYTSFVIAHELGHRQRHGSLWPINFGTAYSHEREIEADDFAIAALKSLYATETQREAAAIPGPVSSLMGMFGEPTALQRLADHIGIAVAFLSEEVFENPFPLLSRSTTHPAFFSRMTRLLDQLIQEAEEDQDEEALRQLTKSKNIAGATASLLRLRPAEIEFANAFQFAFVDDTTLYVVGNDNAEIITRPLNELDPGALERIEGFPPQRRATVRYAWPGDDGETVLIRRDGTLRIVETRSGAIKAERSLDGALGDNSCVKRIILPPAPAAFAYMYFCSADTDHAALIDGEGTVTRINLHALARQALGDADKEAPAVHIAGFDLNAQGDPTLHFIVQDQLYAASLSPALELLHTTPLQLDPDRLPEPQRFRGARFTLAGLITDGAGRSYFVRGSDIFREFALYDAQTPDAKPIAQIDLTPSADAPRVAQDLAIFDSYHLSGNRLIINLVRGGAYLIDFDRRSLVPLSRQGFSNMEQILSNTRGDWILYRKYSTRILLFRETADE